LRTAGGSDAFRKAEIALQEEYVRLSGGATSGEAIQTYKLLTVARHIYVSTLFPERKAATSLLLEYCEREM